MKSPPCKTLDNYTSFGKSRLKSSTYSKDYQILKAELVNYKELDSYRNKFKYIFKYLEIYRYLLYIKITKKKSTRGKWREVEVT